MKKALALFLGMLLLLTFVGCGSGNTETTEAAGGDQNTEAASATSMLSSAKKLKTASSYRFSIISINKSNGEELERRKEYLVVKNSDGTATIWNNKNTGSKNDEASSLYYEGNIGYILDGYRSPIGMYKYIHDVPVTIEDLLSEQERLSVSYGEDGVLALFDGMNPTATKEEDGILLEVKDMTKEQFTSLYNALFGLEDTQIPEQFPFSDFAFFGRIDNNGYLKEFTVSLSAEMEGQTSTQEAKMVVDQINSAKTEKPSYVTNYKPEGGFGVGVGSVGEIIMFVGDDTEVVYVNNGQDAHYEITRDYNDGGKTVVAFRGFGRYIWDEYTIEQYKVLSEVEGMPVSYIQVNKNLYSDTIKVKRIVVPSGMGLKLFGGCESDIENTEFYLEDTRESAEVESEIANHAKAVYYAGEWEYVDGIATPKK